MNHSYEGLDRPGGFARGGLLAPLVHRDYRRLLSGLSVSLLGDGVFLVALAWQVYTLKGAPSALGAVGIAMTVPTIACLLLGGALSDRYDRRRVMICADAVRALATAALATLALCGTLTFAELLAVAVVQGAASAFFDPASDAIVPELLEGELLAQANALDQLVRPLALRLAGPALGGLVVALLGSGGAFACDAMSFAISGIAVATLAPGGAPPLTADGGALGSEIADGLRYVAGEPWLWVTLAGAAIAYLLFMGPVEVLLPYVVKEQMHQHAGSLGLVYAAGGGGLARLRAGDRRSWPAAASGPLHLRHLDDRDARGRRLRASPARTGGSRWRASDSTRWRPRARSPGSRSSSGWCPRGCSAASRASIG